ncbi:unnamed protein product [Lupinus luteus]|uniref:Transmembrane protein n=1 Tax=Lupinus luteus TaxID=3873 RepID=A0AAV1WFK3_LUPLU
MNVGVDVVVHVQAVLSILLATFASFGVVISASSTLVEAFRWRRLQALSEQEHGPQLMAQPLQNSRPVNMPQLGPDDDTTQNVVRVQAVLSILLATFASFGVVISASSTLVEAFRWRRLQAMSEQEHGPQLMAQPLQNSRPVNTPQLGPDDDTTQNVVQDQQNASQS